MARRLTEHEMDCVARAFGFNSLMHMAQVFADSDKRRADDRRWREAQAEYRETKRARAVAS